MKIIKGDLILKENTTFNEDLKVEGNIICEGGRWDLNCLNLNCWDLDCLDLNCKDLNCWDLNCRDLSFYAVAIAYHSFKCKSWKAKREKYIIKCLDGKIEVEK